MKRLLCALTALALCAGMLALPVCAATSGPASSSAEPAAASSSAAQSVPAEELAASDSDSESDPTEVPQENSSPNALAAYIVSATATGPSGEELTAILPGQTLNIVVTVADPVIDGGKLEDDMKANEAKPAKNRKPAENFISARLASSSFLHTGPAEVGPYYGGGRGTFRTGDYYRYTLIFRDVIYLGNGNTFSFDISYPTSTLEWKQLSFTVGQCLELPDEETGGEGDSSRTPHLMVRSSSYGNELINAGQPFTLAVTVYATKGSESLDDVTVTLDLRSEGVSLQSGTLSQYLGSMRANSTQEVYFTILPSISFTGGVADIGVTLQGFGSNTGTESNGSVSISVPIEQPDRFEVTGIEISDTMYIGEGGSVTLNFVNKGLTPVSNLEASISGQNLGCDITQQYLGNIAAGTENSADFDLFPETEGPVTGTITLSYEAADGSSKTLTEEFSSNAVMMEMFDDPGMMEDPGVVEPAKAGFPLWGKLLIGAAVVGGGVAGVVLVRRHRKKKALASLETADEDF